MFSTIPSLVLIFFGVALFESWSLGKTLLENTHLDFWVGLLGKILTYSPLSNDDNSVVSWIKSASSSLFDLKVIIYKYFLICEVIQVFIKLYIVLSLFTFADCFFYLIINLIYYYVLHQLLLLFLIPPCLEDFLS